MSPLLLASLLLASPARADEAADKREARIKEVKSHCFSVKAFPTLAEMFASMPADGPYKFAAEAPPGDSYKELCATLESLLSKGTNRDSGGANIRSIVKFLPPAEWIFLAQLETERRKLYAELGSGGWGNTKQNLGIACKGHLCYERADTLKERMRTNYMSAKKNKWETVNLVANKGKIGITFIQGGEHNVPCFFHNGWEVVADAWDDSLLPAWLWWSTWDSKTWEKIGHYSPNKHCLSPEEIDRLGK